MDHLRAAIGKAMFCLGALGIALASVPVMAAGAPEFQRLLPAVGGYVNALGATATRIFVVGTTTSHYRDFADSRWTEISDSLARRGAGKVFTHGNLVVFDQGGGKAVLSPDNGRTWRNLVYASGENKDWFWLAHVGKHGIFYGCAFFEAPPSTFGLFRSADTGRTWSRHLGTHPVQSVADMGEDLAVSTADSGVYRFRPQDNRVERMSAGLGADPNGFSLIGNGGGDILAFRSGAPMHKYSPGTNRWPVVLSGDDDFQIFSAEIVGSMAYVHAYGADQEEFMQRSTDGGSTWEPARSIGSRQVHLLLPRGDTVYLARSNALEAYHWPTRSWWMDSAGRRSDFIGNFRVLGSSVLALQSWDGNILGRSDDLGVGWRRIASMGSWVTGLFRSRESILYQHGPDVIQYALDMDSPDTLPRMRFNGGMVQIVDAGTRYYARANPNRWGGGQAVEAESLLTLQKGSSLWSLQPHPFGKLDELAAEDDGVLVRRHDSLAHSSNAGNTWTRLTGLPFRSPSGIFRQAGHWLAATELGLFKSASTGSGWVSLGLPPRPCRVFAHSVNRILVESDGMLQLSQDRGATWSRISPLPLSVAFLERVDLSDSLLCIYGQKASEAGVDTYCMEHGPLPSGTRAVWTRMPAPGIGRFFNGNQLTFGRPGAKVAVQVDGRLVPAKWRTPSPAAP